MSKSPIAASPTSFKSKGRSVGATSTAQSRRYRSFISTRAGSSFLDSPPKLPVPVPHASELGEVASQLSQLRRRYDALRTREPLQQLVELRQRLALAERVEAAGSASYQGQQLEVARLSEQVQAAKKQREEAAALTQCYEKVHERLTAEWLVLKERKRQLLQAVDQADFVVEERSRKQRQSVEAGVRTKLAFEALDQHVVETLQERTTQVQTLQTVARYTRQNALKRAERAERLRLIIELAAVDEKKATRQRHSLLLHRFWHMFLDAKRKALIGRTRDETYVKLRKAARHGSVNDIALHYLENQQSFGQCIQAIATVKARIEQLHQLNAELEAKLKPLQFAERPAELKQAEQAEDLRTTLAKEYATLRHLRVLKHRLQLWTAKITAPFRTASGSQDTLHDSLAALKDQLGETLQPAPRSLQDLFPHGFRFEAPALTADEPAMTALITNSE